MNFKNLAPFKSHLRSAWHWYKSLPRQRAIRKALLPPSGEIRVFYGHDHIPRPDDHAYGGIVKFQRMQSLYPNSPACFNVLYMVSSQSPRGAAHLARVAQKKGLALVWNQNGVAYPGWHGPGWEQVNGPMAKILHSADYVFYQSEFCRLSADRYLGERQGPWEILYNSVDTSVFTPPEGDPAPGELVILLGGTQYQYYRFATAVETLARVCRSQPETRLIVTGRLSWIADEKEAFRLAQDLAIKLKVKDRVEFLGPYAQTDAPAIYRRAHLLLHTKYNDPCPGLVVEAMASGLPVVYSHSGGVPELVGPDAGIGVPAELNWERDLPPDPESLAQAVLKVAERYREYTHAARRRAVENFDLQPWLQRHKDIFSGLCTEKMWERERKEPH